MTRLRILITVLGMTIGTGACHAQSSSGNKTRRGLDDFRRAVRADFNDFRRQAMKEFTDFVRNPWKEFEHTPAVPVPEEKPVPPVVMPEEDKDKPLLDKPIVIKDIIKPIVVIPQPQPVAPVIEVPVVRDKYTEFTFFGTKARVRFDKACRIDVKGVESNDVADALKRITPEKYDNMLYDCLALRESLQLSDWAYLQMLKALSDEIEGHGTNGSALLLAYLYMQSGYKMRLATDGTKLYVLYGTRHVIYEIISYGLDGDRYYGVEKLPQRLRICDVAFPKEKGMSLLINTNQKFEADMSEKRKIASKVFKDFTVESSVNKNLLEFYSSYPTSMVDDDMMTRWAMYANTPVEAEVKAQLYPQLEAKLKGLSQKEAVERILNWVQTGFEYEYDNKVWGHDRAFFAEETLFYPYCDCEDRSILLTRLVRDLLHLKCILVYYPGHLASAVELTGTDAKGDCIMLDGHKYIIADGTYINAPLGRTMLQMDNSTAKVILLE